jgi:hypothetical protein
MIDRREPNVAERDLAKKKRQKESEGEVELARLLRRVDLEVRRFDSEAMDLPHVPSDVTRAVLQSLRMLWMVRGALLHQAKARALELVGQGMPIPRAALLAGQRLNLPPRRVGPGSFGPLHPQQVRQYHRRQEQRGRQPGQDPRMRKRQREGEAELSRLLVWVNRRIGS